MHGMTQPWICPVTLILLYVPSSLIMPWSWMGQSRAQSIPSPSLLVHAINCASVLSISPKRLPFVPNKTFQLLEIKIFSHSLRMHGIFLSGLCDISLSTLCFFWDSLLGCIQPLWVLPDEGFTLPSLPIAFPQLSESYDPSSRQPFHSYGTWAHQYCAQRVSQPWLYSFYLVWHLAISVAIQ